MCNSHGQIFCIAAVTIGFNPEDYTVNEVDGQAVLNVEVLSGILETTVTVMFQTMSGAATEEGMFGGRVLLSEQVFLADCPF
jgi:hypothetical protein